MTAIKGMDWFVSYILVFYVIFWLLQWFLGGLERIHLLVAAILIIGFGLFVYPLLAPRPGLGVTLFGYNLLFNRMVYILPFLLGAFVSRRRDTLRLRPFWDPCLAIVMILSFYLFYFLAGKYAMITRCQIVIVLPLLGFVYFFNKTVSSGFFAKVMGCRIVSAFVLFVGGLSLEMYLIGSAVKRWVPLLPFPLGYVIGFVSSLALSYFVRSAGRMFSQTFIPPKLQDGYDWKAIFRPY